MNRLENFAASHWDESLSTAIVKTAIEALETGKVLFFPQLPFTLTTAEQQFLHTDFKLRAKNISFTATDGILKNIHCAETAKIILKQFLQRYADYTQRFLDALLPHYKHAVRLGCTSLRPTEIQRRQTSCRKDDTRLHVDAFPASPNHGQRILRVFTNINPTSQPRLWRLGEPFHKAVQTFKSRLQPPFYGSAPLLKWLKLTRGYRTLYDHYMLQLHDMMKADLNYQQSADQLAMPFPAGSSWIVYTDLVSHAVMEGQWTLEQTFYLPVEAMQDEQRAPLRLLEQTLGQKLVPNYLKYPSLQTGKLITP